MAAKINDIFAFLDGKKCTRADGIEGTFKHEVLRDQQRLIFKPTAKGRKTEAYRAAKADLGDDWVSDMTDAISEYCDIAIKMGFKYEEVKDA